MVHFRVTPNCTVPYYYYPTNWLVVGCLIELNFAGVVRFRVTPNFTIGFILVVSKTIPGVKGKAEGGDQENHAKKLRKAQRVAKKASQLDDEDRRIQRLRKLARYLEHPLDGMKSAVQKCSIFGNFEGETAKLKHNKCQCCRMVRLDLKLTTTNKGICKKCAPLKNEKYYS